MTLLVNMIHLELWVTLTKIKDNNKKIIFFLSAVPLAGLNAGIEKTLWYKLEKVKSGEIEISITSDFTLPDCNKAIYEKNIQNFLNEDLKEYDPITFQRNPKLVDQKK